MFAYIRHSFPFFISIITIVIISFSCTENTNPSGNTGQCGPEHQPELRYERFDDANPRPNIYLDGNFRIISFTEHVSDICTKEHVETVFRVDFNGEINVDATILYNVLYLRPVTMTKNGNSYTGNDNFGLQHAFGDGPGNFAAVLEIIFPTKGSYALDSAYWVDNLQLALIVTRYKKHK